MTAPSITGFCLARIGEDEKAAREASPGPWSWNGYGSIFREDTDDQEGFDEAGFAAGHAVDKAMVWCEECDGSCELWSESYRRDPHVASVPAIAGDTASGRHAADARHIALNDPDRVLAQCAALRAVVEEHRIYGVCIGDQHEFVYCDAEGTEYPCPTIRHIAGIWRDHNDWREEWSA